MLHFLLDRYAADSAGEPMSFRAWVERRYDPEALMAAYEADPAVELRRRPAAPARVTQAQPSQPTTQTS